MAKTHIYEQEQALSVYFRDMLAEPQKKPVETPQPAETESAPPAPVITEPANDKLSQADGEQTSTAIKSAGGEHKLLLCEIGGMNLAIAVSALNNIVHWPRQGLNQLPGQQDWQLGLLTERQQHAEVIDIRQLLQAPLADTEAQPGYILLVDEKRRGIACDRIQHIVTVEDKAINWRQDTSQRTWFSGVIAETLHSIVDIPALLDELEQR